MAYKIEIKAQTYTIDTYEGWQAKIKALADVGIVYMTSSKEAEKPQKKAKGVSPHA